MRRNQQIFLILLMVVKYLPEKETTLYEKLFQRDLNFCPDCFHHQLNTCIDLFANLEVVSSSFDLNQIINLLSASQRYIKLLKWNQTKRNDRIILGKYLASRWDYGLLKPHLGLVEIRNKFLDPDRLDGVQFCPSAKIPGLIDFFEHKWNLTQISVWIHLLINIQPILLPVLYQNGLPVPQIFATCGFTIFESYDGVPLTEFYSSDFLLKLRIVKKLIEGMELFTNGFDGYRIYITDFTADNVVYNETSDRLYFVDLDTVTIVDVSTAISASTQIHKHEYIDCNNCFAYAPNDICSVSKSDLNMFAVCQFLRENLSKDLTGGFLYPIPDRIHIEHPELMNKLNECVECGKNCENRFHASKELLKVIERILLLNST